MARLNIKVGNNNLKAEMPAELARDMGIAIGKEVYLILKFQKAEGACAVIKLARPTSIAGIIRK